MLIRQDIEVTHRRLAQHPWRKTLLQDEVDFSDLRLGEFVLRLPSISEYREILSRQGVRVADVTPRTIRDINYALVETALCERYHLSARTGRNFIGMLSMESFTKPRGLRLHRPSQYPRRV